MKALVQRVKNASVTVAGEVVGAIGKGLLILLGVRDTDTQSEVTWVADKCANLRIFEDDDGKFNLSAFDTEAEILVVSQFTLYGDCRKGRRPSFIAAARPEISEPLYESFVANLRDMGFTVATGVFGAMMDVSLCNDGPVTIMVEREAGS